MSPLHSLRRNWPEYAIEAWALGMFMISAGAFTVLLEHPDSVVRQAIGNADLRRALVGLAMGSTAIALIYSPWGRRSGAHMNPAVTLAFLQMRKIARFDAACFIISQFIGGVLGVLACVAIFGARFAGTPVNFVVTQPGHGAALAFLCELLISGALMATVLIFSKSRRIKPYTGVAAGTLVALYIAIEAPISGMSMNPARSFASAAASGSWGDLWIYLIAPPLGMALAVAIFTGSANLRTQLCAKLYHADDVRCIHCGYIPPYGDRLHDDDTTVKE